MENRTYFAEFELLVQFSLFAKDYIDEGPLVIITIAFGVPSKSFLISCFHQISSFELTPVNISFYIYNLLHLINSSGNVSNISGLLIILIVLLIVYWSFCYVQSLHKFRSLQIYHVLKQAPYFSLRRQLQNNFHWATFLIIAHFTYSTYKQIVFRILALANLPVLSVNYAFFHCVKSVQIRSFFLVRVFLCSNWIHENTDQKKLSSSVNKLLHK